MEQKIKKIKGFDMKYKDLEYNVKEFYCPGDLIELSFKVKNSGSKVWPSGTVFIS